MQQRLQPLSLVKLTSNAIAKCCESVPGGIATVCEDLRRYLPRAVLHIVCQCLHLDPYDKGHLLYHSRLNRRRLFGKSEPDIWLLYRNYPKCSFLQDPLYQNPTTGECWLKKEEILYRTHMCNGNYDYYVSIIRLRTSAAKERDRLVEMQQQQ